MNDTLNFSLFSDQFLIESPYFDDQLDNKDVQKLVAEVVQGGHERERCLDGKVGLLAFGEC